MSKLTFARTNGRFDFSEARLEHLNAQLRDRCGEGGPRTPETFMAAACRELVRASHEIADRKGIEFHLAAKRVVQERPELFKATRGIAVPDGDQSADFEVA